MEVPVRRIRPGEGDELRGVRLRALADAPGAFASTFAEESALPAAAWSEFAERRSAGEWDATFVAGGRARFVGLAGAYRTREEPGVANLVSMWVAPECRRAGLAQRLVDEVVAWAAAAGAGSVELWVARDNEGATAFYRTAGFLETEDYQPLPSDPCREELRMVRPLDVSSA